MQSVAQQWLVCKLTGSAALLGLVGFLGQISTLLFTPLGGVLSDRFPQMFSSNTLLQTLSPDELRGRVMSV